MKRKYLFVALFLLISTVCIPLISLGKGAAGTPGGSADVDTLGQVRMLDCDSGAVIKLSLRDYLFGVTAAEMSMSNGDEALKAQIIASHTFTLYRTAENADKKYDITNSTDDQAYKSRSDARMDWGERADEYCLRLDSLIDEVGGYIIADDDRRPILAAYHAVSAGRTESAEVMWGSDYSYLQPVDSVGDLLSPDYLSERSFTPAELAEKLSDEVKLTGDAAKWLGDISRSSSGTVTKISLGGQSLSGSRVRSLLGLRSAVFEVTYADGTFNFKVQGYGHCVGMSQYGANYLAGLGSDYREILGWYYTDCKLISAERL